MSAAQANERKDRARGSTRRRSCPAQQQLSPIISSGCCRVQDSRVVGRVARRSDAPMKALHAESAHECNYSSSLPHICTRIIFQPTTISGPAVVAAVFCLVFLLMGTSFSFSVFATELQRELHASSGAISLIFGCAMALLYGGGLFSGVVADRIGTHTVVGIGALVAGGSLVVGGTIRT